MKKILKIIVSKFPALLVGSIVQCALFLKLNRLAFSIALNAKLPSQLKTISIKTFDVMLQNDGSSLIRLAYYLGADHIEPGELKLWKDLCQASNAILEVGGNIGLYAVIGSKATNGNYTVYEPHPYNYTSLKNNLSLNKVNAICIERAVVSDGGPSEIDLNIPLAETGLPSTGAYINNAEGIDRESYEKFTVKTHSPSDLNFKPDLIKLDVEGAEFEILNSMTKILGEKKSTILVEVRRPEKTEKLRRWIKGFVDANGYIVVAVNAKYPIIATDKILSVVLQNDYDTRDLLLLHESKFDEYCAKGIL